MWCLDWNTTDFLLVTGCVLPETWATTRSRRSAKARSMEPRECKSWSWLRTSWNLCMGGCSGGSRGWKPCKCKGLPLFEQGGSAQGQQCLLKYVTTQPVLLLVACSQGCQYIVSSPRQVWDLCAVLVKWADFHRTDMMGNLWCVKFVHFQSFNAFIILLFPVETAHVGTCLLSLCPSSHCSSTQTGAVL